MASLASPEEVDAFLAEHEFIGYQEIPLPHGKSVPGKRHDRRLEQILGDRAKGKTLLDVGTNYGLFPYWAIQRGEKRAVGLEAQESRYKTASEIAALHGDAYEIKGGFAEDLSTNEVFDIVLVLNVLHHVKNPIQTVLHLSQICRETMIFELSRAEDSAYIDYCYSKFARHLLPKRGLARLHSVLLRLVVGKLPLVAVGNVEYHRTFFFNPAAFYNLFVVHHQVFSDIQFERSCINRDRYIAICRVKA